jgi:putative lipoprotein
VKYSWLTLAVAVGLHAEVKASDAMLSGIASYHERVALPANAIFEATLEDVSRTDAPAVILGQARIDSPPRVPIKFSITFDPKRIDAKHRYVVRARIRLGEQSLYVTDIAPEVDFSVSSPVEIRLRRVGAQEPATTSATPTSITLEDTYWRLTLLKSQTVIVTDQRLEPYIRLRAQEKQLVAFGGCNQMSGSYTLDGTKLTFSQLGGTLKACAQGMETEGAVHSVLEKTVRWRIDVQRLTLLDSAGATLAQFEQRIVK